MDYPQIRLVFKKYWEKFIRKARPRFTNNFKTKLIVVFMSITLWFFIVTEDEYTYQVDIPIRIENISDDKIIENDYPNKVKVMFYGTGKALIGLYFEQEVALVINMEHERKSTTIPLTIDYIPSHNLEVKPIKIIEPDSIEIRLANIKTKKVPVRHQIKLSPLAGYTLVGDIVLQPDSVLIRGPVTEISKIQFVATENLELDNLKNHTIRKIALFPLESDKVQVLTTKIQAKFDIQKLMEKVIPRVPVLVENLPPGMRALVLPPTLSLTLEGGVKVLSSVTENDIKAFIDYKRKKKKNQEGHPAIIKTPPGIIYRDVRPQTFKIVLERI